MRFNFQIKCLSLFPMIAALVALSILGLSTPVMGKVTWQRLAQAARERAEHNQFDDALRAYDLAIQMAATDPYVPEAPLNLKLCLAETLRKAQRYEDCSAVLKSIEPQILGKTTGDPLMEARFWVRKADLAEDSKNDVAALEASRKALECRARCFNHDSADYLKFWQRYMWKLVHLANPRGFIDELRRFGKTNSWLIEHDSATRSCFTQACSAGAHLIMRSLDEKRYDDAFDLLYVIDSLSPHPMENVGMWLSLQDHCKRSNHPSIVAKLPSTYFELAKIAQQKKLSPEQQIGLHSLLLGAYSLLEKHAGTMDEWRAIKTVFDSAGANGFKSRDLLFTRCTATFSLLEDHDKWKNIKERDQDFGEVLSTDVKFTRIVDHAPAVPLYSFLRSVVNWRYSSFLLDHDKIEEADNLIAGIPVQTWLPLGIRTLVFARMRLADGYLMRKQKPKALSEFSMGAKYFDQMTDCAEDIDVWRAACQVGSRLGLSVAQLPARPRKRAPLSSEHGGGTKKRI
jgi:hypothetical protein